ncbi:hypothetical protein C7960_1892 [Methanohalophilus euhalobius]|uniref:Uncharacterized protein n=1 Tax=Methanohalophilus euhalobius TaxID=51203 RepID=A0A285F1H9_9EURY|nr:MULTISPECIES: hypothetical protein [Methanohalophilus]ODV50659.1 MAG: hypothetical protein A8273_200 [Methanohalophilus sp. 2-GBenrich]TCL12622.1 hypothetical protein C7960_1892 [Methanohalophilus euhalobius]SNY04041.1 hypothetical protein SAMN06295989_102270 [Methanohalophilus euhalobius]
MIRRERRQLEADDNSGLIISSLTKEPVRYDSFEERSAYPYNCVIDFHFVEYQIKNRLVNNKCTYIKKTPISREKRSFKNSDSLKKKKGFRKNNYVKPTSQKDKIKNNELKLDLADFIKSSNHTADKNHLFSSNSENTSNTHCNIPKKCITCNDKHNCRLLKQGFEEICKR